MSTLKTHNLQSPDAGSVNIALAPNAGMIVAGISTFSEDTKFIGALSGRDLQWDKSDNALEFLDYTSAYFGTDNNLQIYHNAGNNNSYISENGVGSLLIQASDLYLNNSAGQNYVICATGGRVQLNFAGNNKLETTSSGATVTGALISSFGGINTRLGFVSGGAEGVIETTTNHSLVLGVNSSEKLRIDTSGSLLIANTTGSRTNLSNNADDIVIGNTSTSNETGISMFSTSASGIRFNDASGTDAAIEYAHSARELRFNSAGANRLQFGINASNSPVFSLGTGHYSGDSNNHNQGDRASVKVGAYLHLESALGAGHNSRAGLGYNCYFSSLENFNCGTKSPSSGDNRPAAYGMAYGNHYFYSDASNTAHSAQASLTMTKNMIIHRQGYVTKPNNPFFDANKDNGHVSSTSVIVYNKTSTNNGNHYSTSNGRFTAPVAGYYQFWWGCIKGNTSSVVRSFMRKNGSSSNMNNNRQLRMDSNAGNYGDNGAITLIAYLNQNDYVQVVVTEGTVYGSGEDYTYFIGVLLG